jgi:UDP-N-acetylglucosamine 2-epimerase (non-hydrolysing)
MKTVSVVGARPNFMKIAPIVTELSQRSVENVLVHTGQHYDENMSQIFFTHLELPEPDAWLEVGPNSPATQFGEIMMRFENVLVEQQPDLVIVVGDVNSTAACAITASKLNISIAHVESGLRSFDRIMPEEINRIITDHLSELLFVTEPSGLINLVNEGIPEEKIHHVGNVMIDTLLDLKPRFDESDILSRLKVKPQDYAVVTLHRPSNVDDKDTLAGIIRALQRVSQQASIIFPAHPRTCKNLEYMGISTEGLRLIPPLGYLDFMRLFSQAKLILTDSGGIQEEATVLKVPCLTLRENTERPITVTAGINKVIGTEPERIIGEAEEIISGANPPSKIPELWDGKTAVRIVKIILDRCA